jgi:hypothetical protein
MWGKSSVSSRVSSYGSISESHQNIDEKELNDTSGSGLEVQHPSKIGMIANSAVYIWIVVLVMIGVASLGDVSLKSTIFRYQGPR